MQLWHVGAGLPLDALIKGSITDWKCTHRLSAAEILPLNDALVRNTSLKRLNLAEAGMEWQAAEGSAAPLVEALRSNDGLSGLSLLIISNASRYENPVGKLRAGPEQALEAFKGVTFFARDQGAGPWAADLIVCGDVLNKNKNQGTATEREKEVGEAVTKLLIEAHNGEVGRHRTAPTARGSAGPSSAPPRPRLRSTLAHSGPRAPLHTLAHAPPCPPRSRWIASCGSSVPSDGWQAAIYGARTSSAC